MNLLFEKSFSSLETSNGVKKKSFKIIKSEDNSFKKIAGLSNDGKSYIVNENIKKILPNNGIINKHRTFKINSSEVSSLLNDHFSIQKNMSNNHLLKSFINIKKNTLHKPTKTLSLIKSTLSKSKNTSKNASKKSSKKSSKSASNNLSKSASKNASNNLSKSASNNLSKSASKKSSKNASKNVSKNVSKNASKNASKKNTHKSIQ